MLAGDCLRLCEEHSEAWLSMNSGHGLAMQIVKAQVRSQDAFLQLHDENSDYGLYT